MRMIESQVNNLSRYLGSGLRTFFLWHQDVPGVPALRFFGVTSRRNEPQEPEKRLRGDASRENSVLCWSLGARHCRVPLASRNEWERAKKCGLGGGQPAICVALAH